MNYRINLLTLLVLLFFSSSYSLSGLHLRGFQRNLPLLGYRSLHQYNAAVRRRSLSASASASVGIIDYQSQISKIEKNIEEVKADIQQCDKKIQEIGTSITFATLGIKEDEENIEAMTKSLLSADKMVNNILNGRKAYLMSGVAIQKANMAYLKRDQTYLKDE